MKYRTVLYGSEYMRLYSDGSIARMLDAGGRTRAAMQWTRMSDQWRVTGAVSRNNFGGVTRRYTLAEVINDPASIPWRWKNGAQRTFITDLDHGTHREWRSPDHRVFDGWGEDGNAE